ncbi:MAG: PAS domain-containing sensor histidine kinase [Rhabdochlamydiaceae bacterium]|nr:PAS domain-containing sensor histidine kinase [Candidatus Amphrikana amoebophyrae]
MTNSLSFYEDEFYLENQSIFEEKAYLNASINLLQKLSFSTNLSDILLSIINELKQIITFQNVSFIMLHSTQKRDVELIYSIVSEPIGRVYQNTVISQIEDELKQLDGKFHNIDAFIAQFSQPKYFEYLHSGSNFIESSSLIPSQYFTIPFTSENKILGLFHIGINDPNKTYSHFMEKRASDFLQLAAHNYTSIQKLIKQGKRESQRFKLATESSVESVVMFNKEFSIEYANSSFYTLSGYSSIDTINIQFLQLVKYTNNSQDIKEVITEQMNEKKQFTSEDIKLLKQDGTEVDIHLSIYPVIKKSIPTFFVALIQDISERKKLARMQSEFVAIVSHQFRSPLAVIQMALEAIRNEDEKNDIINQCLENISNSNAALLKLVKEILTMSQLESGHLSMSNRPINLIESINRVVEEIKPLIEQQECTLTVKTPNFNLPNLLLDSTLIETVIHNFLSNALRYSPRQSEIEIELKQEENEYILSVSDMGIGIIPEEQKNVFKKFYRTNRSRKKVPSGTGLGLYIVKLIAEKYGGKIWFQSPRIEDKGTIFFLSLPRLLET